MTSSKLPYFLKKISARDNRGNAKFLSHVNKTTSFLWNFELVIIGAVQIFKSHQWNCFIFVKISARDNMGQVKYSSERIRMVLFSRTFSLSPLRIQSECGKIRTRKNSVFGHNSHSDKDKRDNLNFQVTSSKLPHILQKFQLVIVGAVQIFKSHQQHCFIYGKYFTSW